MINLVIGNTSQLAYYFPESYIKISSRNIDFEYLKNNQWDSVYITFAEQRIHDINIDYITPNYFYTLQIINSLLSSAKKIVIYTSAMLWSDSKDKKISINTPPVFSPIGSEYTLSKALLFNKILELRKSDSIYNKVIIIHPFYFNSIHRTNYFLFGKIFDSIVNKKKIKTGNLNFYRDLVHTRFLVQESILAKEDSLIGAGKLFNVRSFVEDLYKLNNLNIEDFIEEDANLISKNNMLRPEQIKYSYEQLLADTQADIVVAKEGK